MIVPFDELPEESRVWIYQSNRVFTVEELDFIRVNANDFLNNWTAHGANLQAAIDIPYDRFLVIALNESLQSASGCSIDSSVRFIQNLEKKLGIILLDKMNVTYRIRNKIEYVTYQEENIKETLSLCDSPSTTFGLAVTSDTSIEKFEDYKSHCEFILLMTTTPGESGGTFNKINFKKIRDFKKKYPSKKVHIDGGVNDEIALILRIHGVKSVVSGSYLVNGDIAKSLLELKSSVSDSDMPVSEFMLIKEELPIIKENEKIEKALEKIESYDLGFVYVENENNDFTGVVSMADVRKSLIKSLDDFKNLG